MRKLLLVALVLCTMIGFAAEPTTSTELDIHEGRAHAVVMHGTAAIGTHGLARPDARPTPALAVVVALLALVVLARRRPVAAGDAWGDASSLAASSLGRRGPPARA